MNYKIVIFLTTSLFLTIDSAVAREKLPNFNPKVNLLAKLELQTLPDRGIPISGCSCSIVNRKNRTITQYPRTWKLQFLGEFPL